MQERFGCFEGGGRCVVFSSMGAPNAFLRDELRAELALASITQLRADVAVTSSLWRRIPTGLVLYCFSSHIRALLFFLRLFLCFHYHLFTHCKKKCWYNTIIIRSIR